MIPLRKIIVRFNKFSDQKKRNIVQHSFLTSKMHSTQFGTMDYSLNYDVFYPFDYTH